VYTVKVERGVFHRVAQNDERDEVVTLIPQKETKRKRKRVEHQSTNKLQGEGERENPQERTMKKSN
jgi:hypothetical protein